MIPRAGGLHKFFPLYNFVGNLEKSWLHGPALLRRVGVWDQFGAREWCDYDPHTYLYQTVYDHYMYSRLKHLFDVSMFNITCGANSQALPFLFALTGR